MGDLVGVTFGAHSSFGRDSWPVWVACDVSTCFEVESKWRQNLDYSEDFASVDIHPGLRKVWDGARWRTSIGGGPAFHLVSRQISSVLTFWSPATEATGSGVGFWLSARAALKLGLFQVGADAGLSRARASTESPVLGGMTIEDEVESGGHALGLFMGIGW